ncbi:MAG TPA: hypothetical protein VFO10_02825 [Oligoflexus sp.]|uniref:pPIWI-associating nuclease domain-containing protein n=1 Tax=Oligoflexus sp. TaxID=1971216 RepID=UPI002D7EF8E1|nr:hypothetical protein [Oligoflexus sp.]HET9236156.1 hypothetical protein [Oligoflexus sp.]
MVRKMTPAQYNAYVREINRKNKQAVDKYNRQVDAHNRKVKQSINDYNREVRSYNSKVRANQQRIKNELERLNRQQMTVTWKVEYRQSTQTLHQSYDRLLDFFDSQEDSRFENLIDLSEQEAINSLEVAKSILDSSSSDSTQMDIGHDHTAVNLNRFSKDLDDRWQGAVYALNPKNPDAARHFCTSAREVIVRMLDMKAPDHQVLTAMPDCHKTDKGAPSRRSKILYLIERRGWVAGPLADFVDSDIDNVMELFRVLNDGTHGSAGTFSMSQLLQIRNRVESGISFLTAVIGDL